MEIITILIMAIPVYLIIGILNGIKNMSYRDDIIEPKDVFLWPLEMLGILD